MQILSLAAALLVGATTAQLVPDGSVDIGTVGFEGSSVAGANEGDWVVSGSGSDIWSSYDHFHYMYFNQTGDVTITCFVNSFTGSTNGWRKAGPMFRSDIGQRSPHSHLQVTGWGVAQQSRLGLNWNSISYHDHFAYENVWLRLVKSGNTITSYVKNKDDYDYLQFNEVEVDLGEEFKVGIAVTSHDNNALGALDISNLEITNEVYTLGTTGSTQRNIGDTGTNIRVQQVQEGKWMVRSGGEDIFGSEDSFGFFDSEQTGDIVASMHVDKIVHRDVGARRNMNAKGGLMFRASHAVDAPHVSLLIHSGSGVTMYYRATAGGETISKNVGVMVEDVELKMEKTGNTVSCYYKHVSSPEWYHLGDASADFDTTYYVGQAISSAQRGYWAALYASEVQVTPAAIA